MMDKQEQEDQKEAEKPPETLKDGEEGQLEVAEGKEIIPEGRTLVEKARTNPKINAIKNMFATQHQKADNILEDELKKEERLATKKRLELRWKAKKEHKERMRWTEEWLDERVLSPVIETGRVLVITRVETLVTDILDMSIILGEGRRSARLGKAKERREKLLTYLDRWWTTLEGGDSKS